MTTKLRPIRTTSRSSSVKRSTVSSAARSVMQSRDTAVGRSAEFSKRIASEQLDKLMRLPASRSGKTVTDRIGPSKTSAAECATDAQTPAAIARVGDKEIAPGRGLSAKVRSVSRRKS